MEEIIDREPEKYGYTLKSESGWRDWIQWEKVVELDDKPLYIIKLWTDIGFATVHYFDTKPCLKVEFNFEKETDLGQIEIWAYNILNAIFSN